MSEYILVNLPQGSAEWLDWRRTHITASNVASILEKNPYGTPLSVYEEMIEGSTKPLTPAMRNGIEREEDARVWAEKHLGLSLFPLVAESIKHPWAGASLDGYDLMSNTVVEIKCPGTKNHLLALGGEVPYHYFIQMQWQMMVVGAEKGFYVSYDGSQGIAIAVKRDQKLIENLIFQCKKFYENHILEMIPPSYSDKDFQKGSEAWKEVAKTHYNQLKMIEETKDLLRQMEFEASITRSELESLAGDAKRIMDCGITFYSYQRKGIIEYNKIPELAKVDLEKYRKPSSKVVTTKLCKIKD